MSSRCLQDMSSRRREDDFNVTIFRLPRHPQDILKMSWKAKNCYAEGVLKMSGLLLLYKNVIAILFSKNHTSCFYRSCLR